MDKIKSIGEFFDNDDDGYEYEGFRIVTVSNSGKERTITFVIDNDQRCCEQWGYITSDDDFDSFIGSSIKNIVEVDILYNSKIIEEIDDCECCSAAFLNIETEDGRTLQFVLYNGHNGYYGHQYKIDWGNGKTEMGCL